MKRIFITIAALFFIQNIIAQNAVWVQQGKAPKSERGNAITHDNNGNLYITGSFQDSVRFGTYLLTDNFGDYCAKYDTAGNVIWAFKNMGGDGVVFDGNANIYLFNNDNVTLKKVDLNGTVVWSIPLCTSSIPGSSCGIQDVKIKGTNVFVTGYYSGDGYFGNDTILNAGGWDIFVAKFNDAGQNQWAKTAGGTGLDKGYGIHVNSSDEVYAVGYFKDTANFQATQMISNGAQDMYLAKFDPAGTLLWVNKYGGPGLDLAAKIIADDNNFLYTTGRYLTTITFGATTLTSANTDAFVAKFDAAGNAVWVKGISGLGDDEEADIAYENGKVSFIATISDSVTIGALKIVPIGLLDICIGKIDTNGTLEWAKLFGGINYDEGAGVTLLKGSTYFTGSFNATANFDALSLTASGQWDIVTGKLDNAGPNAVAHFSAIENQVIIYPNPASEVLQIQLSASQKTSITVKLMDMTGRVLQQTNEEVSKGINRWQFDIKDFSEGLYSVQVYEGNKLVQAEKMMKR